MRSLQTLRTLAGIGRILSKIVFVFAVVGVCLSVAGMSTLPFSFKAFEIGKVKILGLLDLGREDNIPVVYMHLGLAAVICAAHAVIAKFAEVYFRNELAEGQPFTARGAGELTRLGILNIVIPVVLTAVRVVCSMLSSSLFHGVLTLQYDADPSIILGVMLIVLACFCRYGAELRGSLPEEGKEED